MKLANAKETAEAANAERISSWKSFGLTWRQRRVGCLVRRRPVSSGRGRPRN